MTPPLVGTRPLVCVLVRNNLFGWPPSRKPDGTLNIPEGDDSVAYLPLEEALRLELPSDLHLVQYSVPDLPHRLIDGAPERLAGPDNQDGRISSARGVPLQLLIAEVDCPKTERRDGRASEDWWAFERFKILRLQAEQPGVLAYRSRGGYRLLAWLPQQHLVTDAASARAWRELYLLHIAGLHARYGIACDPACSEWQRLQRAPYALRGDAREPGEFVGDPDAVGTWDLTLADPEQAIASMHALAETRRSWAQALAFIEAAPGAGPAIPEQAPEAPAGPAAALLDALVPVVGEVRVNGGRHELYLALCGTLLDRGMPAEDLPAFARQLSERAGVDEPRLVADRVKTAQSTIARAASGALYSRIGRLQADYPQVAAVVDALWPSQRPAALRGLLRSLCRPDPAGDGAPQLPHLVEGSDLEVARIAVHQIQAEGGEVIHDLDDFWVCPPGEGVWVPQGRFVLEEVMHRLDGIPVGRETFKANTSRVKGALDRAETLVRVPGFFAGAAVGIGFQNGFLRVGPRGDALLEAPSASHRVSEVLPFSYDPSAPCELWLQTLSQVFAGDTDAADKIELLREYVGSGILGAATRWQACLALEGALGANGKSTVLKVLGRLVSGRARASIPPQKWGNEYYMARLAGVLLNLVAEMPRLDIASTEEFKGVVAGDEQTGRHPRGQPFEFAPRAAHIFACNELPGTLEQTEAYWRRFHVIAFNRRFSENEQVRDLAEQITVAELPGIAAWAVSGACRAFERGALTIPASSAERKRAWRMASNQVALWARERLEPTDDDGASVERAYRDFRDWTISNGHKGMSSQKFEERMAALGYTILRNGHAEWAGVRLRSAVTTVGHAITARSISS